MGDASTGSTAEDFDWLVLQKRANDEFSRRIAAVADWGGPTPDTEWNVTQLVTHVIEEQQWVPLLLQGRTLAQAQLAKRPIEGDLPAEWERYAEAAAAAWAEVEWSAPVRLSYDTVTAAQYLREQVADTTIHSWDLARAVGADERLDDELVAAVWTVFAPQKDALVASGLYAPPVPLTADAPLQSKLLAITGRDDGLAS